MTNYINFKQKCLMLNYLSLRKVSEMFINFIVLEYVSVAYVSTMMSSKVSPPVSSFFWLVVNRLWEAAPLIVTRSHIIFW